MKFTILVCDDSALIRRRTTNIAKVLQIEALEAVNGQECVDLYKKHRPDVVFLDMVMPVKSGMEALREIIAFNKDAKVIIVSSMGTANKVIEALKAGAQDFLQKPVPEEKIYTMLKNLMEKGEYN